MEANGEPPARQILSPHRLRQKAVALRAGSLEANGQGHFERHESRARGGISAVARASSPHAAKACPERREGMAALPPARGRLDTRWRCGLRQLRRNPGFTAVAVLTLALGIGANTAIFSVINGLMLKVIPVSNPDQLVLLSFVDHSGTNYSLSYPAYRRFLELKQDFSGIVASTEGAFRLKMRASGHRQEEAGEVEQVGGEGVSGNYFSELG